MDSVLSQLYTQFYISVAGILRQYGLDSSGATQAIIIVIGVFLITLVLGLARHHMLSWSIKGAWFGIVMGAVITLILEGALLVGGKTAVGELVKNNRTPENVRGFLQKNMSELAEAVSGEPKTLGASSPEGTSEIIISEFESLPLRDQAKVQKAICTP